MTKRTMRMMSTFWVSRCYNKSSMLSSEHLVDSGCGIISRTSEGFASISGS